MKKFSPIQWLGLFFFLIFYGFAVFALTRDYYLRQFPKWQAEQAVQIPTSPHGARQTNSKPRPAPLPVIDDAVPPSVVESNPVLLAQRGDSLFSQQRYAEAITVYRRVLEMDPADADSGNDLGLALHYAGQTPAALEVLRAGTQSAPSFQRIWLTLGFVSSQAGDIDSARHALQTARDLGPDSGVGQEAARLLGIIDGG